MTERLPTGCQCCTGAPCDKIQRAGQRVVLPPQHAGLLSATGHHGHVRFLFFHSGQLSVEDDGRGDSSFCRPFFGRRGAGRSLFFFLFFVNTAVVLEAAQRRILATVVRAQQATGSDDFTPCRPGPASVGAAPSLMTGLADCVGLLADEPTGPSCFRGSHNGT